MEQLPGNLRTMVESFNCLVPGVRCNEATLNSIVHDIIVNHAGTMRVVLPQGSLFALRREQNLHGVVVKLGLRNSGKSPERIDTFRVNIVWNLVDGKNRSPQRRRDC